MENGIRRSVQLSRGTVQVKPNSGPRIQERENYREKEFREEQNARCTAVRERNVVSEGENRLADGS